MNQANIAALAGEIAAIWRDTLIHKYGSWDDESYRDLAQRLAARGVLVPASLTDDDCRDAVDAQTNIWEIVPREPADVRATLDRIAKGGEKPVRQRKACASLTSHEWAPTDTPGHYRCRLCPATQRRYDDMG